MKSSPTWDHHPDRHPFLDHGQLPLRGRPPILVSAHLHIAKPDTKLTDAEVVILQRLRSFMVFVAMILITACGAAMALLAWV